MVSREPVLRGVDGAAVLSSSFCSINSPIAVGIYAPNAWGLYDMHGNVWEWCLDSWDSYTGTAQTDPFVTGGSLRVLRGGSWNDSSGSCRSAIRYSIDPSFRGNTIGFRVVLAPVLVP